MVLPINDRSDVEISLVLHPVFIYKIVKKESQGMWDRSNFVR